MLAITTLLLARLANAGLSEVMEQLMGAQSPNRLAVVLVDTTGSINNADWALYERSYQVLLDSNKVGDRVVLATISDQPVTRFIAIADRTIIRKNIRLEDEASLKRTNTALTQDFQQTKAQTTKPAQATYILDSLTATEQLFSQARAKHQQITLLVLSDMIEESPAANFSRKPPNEASAKQIINTRRTQGLLPDLNDVQVYVVGAGGKSGEQMVRIQKFWINYFSNTGATVQAYGRNPAEIMR